MSEPTYTRQELRRAICVELQMPFFRRVPDGELTPDSTSTTSLIKDATLTQKDGFWSGKWYYGVTGGDVSLTRSFDRSNTQFQLETAIEASSNAEQPYEIHDLWNAIDIHQAINRAIESVKRVFTDNVEDKSLILEQDKLSYTVSSLTKTPFRIAKVWLENPGNIERGTATAGGASTITVAHLPSGIDTNWKVSIYFGTGKGQIRNYASNTGNAITVSSPWSTTPDSTSQYALWDATEERYDWTPLDAFYMDVNEFPNTLYIRNRMTSYYGVRIRIQYESLPEPLSAETDTTIVPKEYIIYKSCAFLHASKLGDTKADRDLHFSMMRTYEDSANLFRRENAPQPPAQSMMAHETRTFIDQDDPLNWDRWGA